MTDQSLSIILSLTSEVKMYKRAYFTLKKSRAKKIAQSKTESIYEFDYEKISAERTA